MPCIIVALFVALVIIGLALDSEDENTATPASSGSTSAKPSASASEVPMAKIGEKVKDDGY